MFLFGNYQETTVVGRLGKKPVLQEVGQGEQKKFVCRFSVAANNRVNNGGQWVDKPEWFRVVAWNHDAEMCARYLDKGQLVCVRGHNQTRSYIDQQGLDHNITELVAAIVVSIAATNKEGDNQTNRYLDDTEKFETGAVLAEEAEDNSENEFVLEEDDYEDDEGL